MFITDFFLLVIMFIGLLRIHHRGASTLTLGSLLCKQVKCCASQMAVVFPFR